MDTITICLGSSCFARGNGAFMNTVKQFLADNDLEDSVVFKGELCSNNCNCGPNIKIGDTLYSELDEQKILATLSSLLKK
jgi:NADH:ubiquinone oxidoreductase subunit E